MSGVGGAAYAGRGGPGRGGFAPPGGRGGFQGGRGMNPGMGRGMGGRGPGRGMGPPGMHGGFHGGAPPPPPQMPLGGLQPTTPPVFIGHLDNRQPGSVTEIVFNLPVTIEGVHIVPADMSPPGLAGLTSTPVIGVTSPTIAQGPFDVSFSIHPLAQLTGKRRGDMKVMAELPSVRGGVQWFGFSPEDAALHTNVLIVQGTFERLSLVLHGTVIAAPEKDLSAQALASFHQGKPQSMLVNKGPYVLDGSDWNYIAPPPKEGGDPAGRDWAPARANRRIPTSLSLALMPPPFLPQLDSTTSTTTTTSSSSRAGKDKHKGDARHRARATPASTRGLVTAGLKAALDAGDMGLSVPVHALTDLLRRERCVPECAVFATETTPKTPLQPTVLVDREMVDCLATAIADLKTDPTVSVRARAATMQDLAAGVLAVVESVCVHPDDPARGAAATAELAAGDMFGSDSDSDSDSDGGGTGGGDGGGGVSSGSFVTVRTSRGSEVEVVEMVTLEEVVGVGLRDVLVAAVMDALAVLVDTEPLPADVSMADWISAGRAALELTQACMQIQPLAVDLAAAGVLTTLSAVLQQEDLPDSLAGMAAEAVASGVARHPLVAEAFVAVAGDGGRGGSGAHARAGAGASAYQRSVEALAGRLLGDPATAPLRSVLNTCALLGAGQDMDATLLQLTDELSTTNEHLSRRLTSPSNGFTTPDANSITSGSIGELEKSEAVVADLLSGCAMSLQNIARKASVVVEAFLCAVEAVRRGSRVEGSRVSVTTHLLLRRVGYTRALLVLSSVCASTREAADVCDGLEATLDAVESLTQRLVGAVALQPGGELALCLGARELAVSAMLLDSFTGGQGSDGQAMTNIWALQSVPVVPAQSSSTATAGASIEEPLYSLSKLSTGLSLRAPDSASVGWYLWLVAHVRSLVDRFLVAHTSVVVVVGANDDDEAHAHANDGEKGMGERGEEALRLAELLAGMCDLDGTRMAVAAVVLGGGGGGGALTGLATALSEAKRVGGNVSILYRSHLIAVLGAVLSEAGVGVGAWTVPATDGVSGVGVLQPDLSAAVATLVAVRSADAVSASESFSIFTKSAPEGSADAIKAKTDLALQLSSAKGSGLACSGGADEELLWLIVESITALTGAPAPGAAASTAALYSALDDAGIRIGQEVAPGRTSRPDVDTGVSVLVPLLRAHTALRVLRELPSAVLCYVDEREGVSVPGFSLLLRLTNQLSAWLGAGAAGAGAGADVSDGPSATSDAGSDPLPGRRMALQFAVGCLEGCLALLARWASLSMQPFPTRGVHTSLRPPPVVPGGIVVADAALVAHAAVRALQLGVDGSSTRSGGGGAYMAGVVISAGRARAAAASALQAGVAGYVLAEGALAGHGVAQSAVGPCVAGYLADTALARPALLESNLELASEFFTLRTWTAVDAEPSGPVGEAVPSPGVAQGFHHLLAQVRGRSPGGVAQSLMGWAAAAWHAVLVGGLHSSSARVHRVLPRLLGLTVSGSVSAGSAAVAHGATPGGGSCVLVVLLVECTTAAIADFLAGRLRPTASRRGTVPLGLLRLLGTLDSLCSSPGVVFPLIEEGLVEPLLRALRLCPGSCPEVCVALMQVVTTCFTEVAAAYNEVADANADTRAKADAAGADGGGGDGDAAEVSEESAEAEDVLLALSSHMSSALVPVLLLNLRCFLVDDSKEKDAKEGDAGAGADGSAGACVVQQSPAAGAPEVAAQTFLLVTLLTPLDKVRLLTALYGLHRRRERVCGGDDDGADDAAGRSGGSEGQGGVAGNDAFGEYDETGAALSPTGSPSDMDVDEDEGGTEDGGGGGDGGGGSARPGAGANAGRDDVPGLAALIDSLAPRTHDPLEGSLLATKLEALRDGLDFSLLVHVLWREVTTALQGIDMAKDAFARMVDQYSAYQQSRANEALAAFKEASKAAAAEAEAGTPSELAGASKTDLLAASFLLPKVDPPLDWSPTKSLAAAHNSLAGALSGLRAALDVMADCLLTHDRALVNANAMYAIGYGGGQGNPWLGRQATSSLMGALLRSQPLQQLGRPVRGGVLLTETSRFDKNRSARDEIKRYLRLYAMWVSELSMAPLLRLEYHCSEGHAGGAGGSPEAIQVGRVGGQDDTGAHVAVPSDPSLLLSPFTDSAMVATLPGSADGATGAISPPTFTASGSRFFPAGLFDGRHVLVLNNVKWLVDNLRIIRDMAQYQSRTASLGGEIPGVAGTAGVGAPTGPVPALVQGGAAGLLRALPGRAANAAHLPPRDNFLHSVLLFRSLATRGLNCGVLYTDAQAAKLKLQAPVVE